MSYGEEEGDSSLGKDADMIRQITTVTTVTLLALSLCACNSEEEKQLPSTSQPTASVEAENPQPVDRNESSVPEAVEYDPEVDNIDLTLDGGNIRFDHIEKANAKLTDSENALVFVFNYTNSESVPAAVWSTFKLQFFQNGVELTDQVSYSGAGGDQYELVGAFFNEAMQGGTVTFGSIVVPKDNSPITIMVSPNNGDALEDNYQTMETAIDEIADTPSPADDTAAEESNPQPISIGETVSNEQFSVTLTGAYVDSTLSSSDSSVYFEPADGGAFVVLEFDATALTSDQLPVDDYAITNLVADYNGDTYNGWELHYIVSDLWLRFRHTYLDANLPCHVYASTTVPVGALDDGSLSVNMDLVGLPYTIAIR